MTTRAGARDGVTLLDGAAVVTGAAVASVHLRLTVSLASGAGWILVWLAFIGVAATAAGPFLYAATRYGRRQRGGPRTGDRLWCLLGLPWVIATPFRAARVSAELPRVDAYPLVLMLGVGLASIIVLLTLWKNWVLNPRAVAPDEKEPAPWTDRVGLALAVAWPLQGGFVLIAIDR